MSKIIKVIVCLEVSEELASTIEHQSNLIESALIMDDGCGKIESQVLDMAIHKSCYINVTKQDMTIQ